MSLPVACPAGARRLVLLTTVACCVVACGAAGATSVEATRKADFHYKLANGHYQAGNLELTVVELMRAFDFEPEHGDARYLYGVVLFGRKQYEAAVDQCRRALRASPKHYAARNLLGATYVALERWPEAITALEPLLKEPTYTTPYLAHNNIGWAYLKLGSYRQAEKHLQMSVFINPKFCNGHRNLAVLAEERGDATGALDHLEDAMKHCPKVADFYLQRGELLARAGKVLPAEEAFCTCLSIARKERLGKRCRGWVERLARQGGHGVCP